MKVAITGATGLVGRRVVELLSGRIEFIPLGRDNGFDLGKPDVTSWTTGLAKADALLHLAARTDVDRIENERSQKERGPAWTVNVESVRALSNAAFTRRMPMCLVSTDFVFPANTEGPYPEAPATTRGSAETSWYGWTKLMAEEATRRSPENSILRISYPYVARHPTRIDHARRMVQLHKEGKLYPLFADQRITPSFVDDVAEALGIILEKRLAGTFHAASIDRTTPYDFGVRLLQALGRDTSDVRSATFPTHLSSGKALRPKDGGLETASSRRAGLPMRSTEDAIAEFAKQSRET